MKESFIRIEGEELQVKGAHSVDHRVTPRAVPGTGAVLLPVVDTDHAGGGCHPCACRLFTRAGVLGLTKMDWNNNTLYKKLPVTLVYSKAFANIIQQNPNMVNSIFDFRNFM